MSEAMELLEEIDRMIFWDCVDALKSAETREERDRLFLVINRIMSEAVKRRNDLLGNNNI